GRMSRGPQCSRVKSVAGTGNGSNPVGPVRVGLDLVADASDVFVHRLGGLPVGRRLPHTEEELFAGKDVPGGGGELCQEVELAAGKLHRAPVNDLPAGA